MASRRKGLMMFRFATFNMYDVIPASMFGLEFWQRCTCGGTEARMDPCEEELNIPRHLTKQALYVYSAINVLTG